MDYELYEQYWIWLSSITGMTPRKFYQLIALAGDARAIWDDPSMVKDHLDQKTYDALVSARSELAFYKIFSSLEKSNAVAVTRISDLYPTLLNTIFDPPPTLYVRGNANLNADKPLAVVGTRSPSFDGKKTAEEFTQLLAENGVTIVSGLARGIDTCAHTACLNAGGRTIAVLGSGLNSIYPSENTKLAERIIDQGGSLVSEMQLDDLPQKWSFPARNRIISGISEAVLVIEGRENSGAMITASCAAEQSRDVYAVPGSIYSPLSACPNHLIQNGAFPTVSAWDILESQRWGVRPITPSKKKPPENLSEDEAKIINLLRVQALSFGEIANQTGISSANLNSHLTMLILRGIIIRSPGNIYRAY